MHPDLETAIAVLLEEAATAHSVYETESLSGSDDQWSAWYAAYLLEQGLRDLLPRTIGHDLDRLAAQLQDLYVAFGRDDPGGDWVRFYAARLTASERQAAAAGLDRGQDPTER